MTGGWWWIVAAITGLGVLAWCIVLDLRWDTDRRLAGRWLFRARRWQGWTGPLSLLLSAAALGVYCLLALFGEVLASRLGHPLWALLIALPAMLVYAPFVLATTPLPYTAYTGWRRELRAAGADAREQRRIAWWAGLPSLLGLGAMILTIMRVFLPPGPLDGCVERRLT